MRTGGVVLEPRDYATIPVTVASVVVSVALFGGVLLWFWLRERGK